MARTVDWYLEHQDWVARVADERERTRRRGLQDEEQA
jgi:dTDP-D-glucose 4,6-dehydratase